MFLEWNVLLLRKLPDISHIPTLNDRLSIRLSLIGAPFMAPIGISLLICILLIDLIDAKLGEHWPYTILYDPEYELARLYLARLHMRVEVDTRDKTLYI